MISKNAKERESLIARRKELIASKRKKRFPKWTVDEIKFLYGITDRLHPLGNLKIKDKRPSIKGSVSSPGKEVSNYDNTSSTSNICSTSNTNK